jgi:hypothetical protein
LHGVEHLDLLGQMARAGLDVDVGDLLTPTIDGQGAVVGGSLRLEDHAEPQAAQEHVGRALGDDEEIGTASSRVHVNLGGVGGEGRARAIALHGVRSSAVVVQGHHGKGAPAGHRIDDRRGQPTHLGLRGRGVRSIPPEGLLDPDVGEDAVRVERVLDARSSEGHQTLPASLQLQQLSALSAHDLAGSLHGRLLVLVHTHVRDGHGISPARGQPQGALTQTNRLGSGTGGGDSMGGDRAESGGDGQERPEKAAPGMVHGGESS